MTGFDIDVISLMYIRLDVQVVLFLNVMEDDRAVDSNEESEGWMFG